MFCKCHKRQNSNTFRAGWIFLSFAVNSLWLFVYFCRLSLKAMWEFEGCLRSRVHPAPSKCSLFKIISASSFAPCSQRRLPYLTKDGFYGHRVPACFTGEWNILAFPSPGADWHKLRKNLALMVLGVIILKFILSFTQSSIKKKENVWAGSPLTK